MATIFSHPAIPLALFWGRFRGTTSKRLLILCVLLTMLPDADVISFKFGIPYESQWGHRGFTHSVTFSFFIASLCALLARPLKASRASVFCWSFISVLSHAILDALTNGGLGVAFFWPFSHERHFLPFRPVQVSPIGVSGFLSWRGLVVLISEIFWIWLPCLFLSFMVRYVGARKRSPWI